jgi:hypothetical protein
MQDNGPDWSKPMSAKKRAMMIVIDRNNCGNSTDAAEK